MNHNFPITVYLGAAALAMAGCGKQQKTEQAENKRPNIIFVMTDDHANQALSCYGSERIQTPNLDQLAEEGMRFTRSFVTNSISAPSRATLLTGQYSHKNGVIDNHKPFDSTQMTFPKLLQQSGYHTAMIGKWHLKTQPTGFDYWKVLPGQGFYYNPDFITMGEKKRDTGYVTDLITDHVINHIDTLDKDQPFCVLYHHKAPHRTWRPGPQHLNDFKNKHFPEPQTLFDDYEKREAAKEALMRISKNLFLAKDLKVKPKYVKQKGLYPDSAYAKSFYSYEGHYERMTPEQRKAWDSAYKKRNREFHNKNLTGKALTQWKYQQYMKDYMRCIASVDDNMGRLMKYLKKEGLDENTIVVYTSDQGFYLGEHGWFDKRFMYEESLQMPLIVRYPQKINKGTVCKELALNLDLAPTFLDYAGIHIPNKMQGRSLRPLLEGKDPKNWRDAIYYHYYEYPAYHAVKRHYGIRTKHHKLIHFYYDIDQWEFYDLTEDPHEIHNQIDNPQYQDKIEEMKQKLYELRDQYGDSDSLANFYRQRWIDAGNTSNGF